LTPARLISPNVLKIAKTLHPTPVRLSVRQKLTPNSHGRSPHPTPCPHEKLFQQTLLMWDISLNRATQVAIAAVIVTNQGRMIARRPCTVKTVHFHWRWHRFGSEGL